MRIRKSGLPEVIKFGLYTLFPVATLFLFNKPELLSAFPTPEIDQHKKAIDEEKKSLYAVPHDLDGIAKELQKVKQAYSK